MFSDVFFYLIYGMSLVSGHGRTDLSKLGCLECFSLGLLKALKLFLLLLVPLLQQLLVELVALLGHTLFISKAPGF